MSLKHYILEGRKPVDKPLLEWALWMETADLNIARSIVGKLEVSTVFLGLDMNMMGYRGGKPLLFETMVFNHDPDDNTRHGIFDDEHNVIPTQRRWTVYSEAVRGHNWIVDLCRERYPINQQQIK